MEAKPKNWGQVKGGLNSSGNTKTIKTPHYSKKLAEVVGIILGDGNLHKYVKGKKVRCYSIRISGDKNKDLEYLSTYVTNLFFMLFGIKGHIYPSKSSNAVTLLFYSKKLVEFFEKIGLVPGNKVTNGATVPRWIFSNINYLSPFIRGMMDTDGSVFRMSDRDYPLLRLSFTNHNFNFLNSMRNIFITLGFHPSKVIGGVRFYISRQEEIKRYKREGGFANSKHLKRFKCFSAP